MRIIINGEPVAPTTRAKAQIHKEKNPMSNQPGLDNRHRDKDGEISKKHGNTLISTLRQKYGEDFAKGVSSDKKLIDVL
jgi:hypothetical protein